MTLARPEQADQMERGAWNAKARGVRGGFLQTWEWGEFLSHTGYRVQRFQTADGCAQLMRRPLPGGLFYWHCWGGPIGTVDPFELAHRRELSGSVFLRFDPTTDPADDLRDQLWQAEGKPAQTLVLDLHKSTDELLAAMHAKTRYNIRLAQRKGVRVHTVSGSEAEVEVLWQLLLQTMNRNQHCLRDQQYYRLLLQDLAGDPIAHQTSKPIAKLMLADYEGEVLAGNIIVYFDRVATYLHGASSSNRRELMAPYLLHWTAIREAKAMGYAEYDFWGVAPKGASKHPWAGITRFKRGFRGEYVESPGTFDLPMRKHLYRFYRLAKREMTH